MYGIHPLEALRAINTRRALDAMRVEASGIPRDELENRVKRYEEHQQDLRNAGFFKRLFNTTPMPIILGIGENSQPYAYEIAREILTQN